jgi:hypothetical protein
MMTTELKQREYDGKWILSKLMVEPNVDMEAYQDRELLVPRIWMVVGVYDYLIEVEN